MDRQEVVTVLESLANGIDPTTGTRIPHDTFHSADIVRALFTASTLLKAGPAATTDPQNARTRATKFTSAGTPWSGEEDTRLGQEFDAGMTIAQIALRHGRTSGGISSRLVKLGRIDPATVKPRAHSSGSQIVG